MKHRHLPIFLSSDNLPQMNGNVVLFGLKLPAKVYIRKSVHTEKCTYDPRSIRVNSLNKNTPRHYLTAHYKL